MVYACSKIERRGCSRWTAIRCLSSSARKKNARGSPEVEVLVVQADLEDANLDTESGRVGQPGRNCDRDSSRRVVSAANERPSALHVEIGRAHV